jgi:hypothetical protein
MPFLQEGLGYDLGKVFRLGVQGAEGDTDVPILPKLSRLQRLEEVTMPNQPAAGNGGSTSRLHVGRAQFAVPEQQC